MAKLAKRKLNEGNTVYVIEYVDFAQGICVVEGEVISVDEKQNLILISLFGSSFKSYSKDKYGELFFYTHEEAQKTAGKLPVPNSIVWILKENGEISKDVVIGIKNEITEFGWDLNLKFKDRESISVTKMGKEVFLFEESAKARYKAANDIVFSKGKSKKTVEEVVEKALVKIINEGFDISFIEQLEEMNLYINSNEICPEEERQEYFPHFSEYSLSDLKKIKRYLAFRIADELEYFGYSFLEIMRLIISLIKLSELKKLKHRNEKVQFCLSFWSLARDVKYSLKKISLLDKIY